MYKIAVDIMGSDDAPTSELEGIKIALAEVENLQIFAFGTREVIEAYGLTHQRLEYIYTTDVITGDDNAATAFRVKKEASMICALQYVKEHKADAVVSSGNTGAYITAALFMLGRIKGVQRPALATVFPSEIKGKQIVVGDLGAVVDATAQNLAQTGVLVSEMAKIMLNIAQPKVGLLNVGIEEKKGTAAYIEAYQLLQENEQLNFQGNLEARYVLDGTFDALVADGFAGNIVLKSYEGMQSVITRLLKQEIMKQFSTKIGGLLIKPALQEVKAILDYESVGGAVLAGVKAPVVKAHGTTNAIQFSSAIKLSCELLEKQLVQNIEKNIISVE